MYHCILQAARACTYTYAQIPPCMYVCMFTYINIHTLPPSSSHLYTHTRTHIRAVRLKRPEEIFWILREERESSEKSEAVTRQILSSDFPRGELPLVYHDKARGILFSAYYTPAATDAYRLLHIHTHTHTHRTSHIYTDTYPGATAVKNVHV